jgi:hypothetical protein
VYTWEKKGESLSDRTTTPTVKHGGEKNLIVWRCMGWNRVGKLTEVQGIMDPKQYLLKLVGLMNTKQARSLDKWQGNCSEQEIFRVLDQTNGDSSPTGFN